MATRLYYDVYTTASSYPTRSSIWDVEAATPLRYKLDRARFGAGATLNVTYTELSATSGFQGMLYQCVSEPLSGDQTISGTWRGLARCHESSTAANFISQCVIRVFSGDMTTERGVIYGGNTETTVIGEWATATNASAMVPQNSSTNGGVPLDISITPINALDGDVIVVEYGFRALNTVTTSFTATATLYNSQNTTAFADMVTIAGGSAAPWIEFSQNLVFVGDQALGTTDGIEAPFDLTGTMTTPVGLSLAGSIDVDVDIAPTATFTDRKIGRDEYKALVVASAPYLYWPMTEGSGATILDASGNGRDGTITGGAWSTALTGSPFGDTGYNFAAAATGNITWTGTVPAASTANGFTIMFVYQQSANNFLLNSTAANGDPWYFVDGTTAYFYCSGTASGDRFAFVKQATTTYRCVIIRVTKTNGNTALTSEQFMLGQQVSAAGVGGLANNGTRFQIGKGSTTGSATLQQVAYWDRPLTANEIDTFSNAFLIEPTPLAVAGDADLDVGLEGTLTTVHALAGEIDLDVSLDGTQSVSVALAGEIVEDIDLTGTVTVNIPLAGSLDIDFDLVGDMVAGAVPMAIAGEIDVDVSLEGNLFVPERLLLAGEIDIPFDLYGDSFEESFRAGTMDIPFGLDGTITITTLPSATNSTITLSAATATDPTTMVILEPQYRLTEFFMIVGLASQAPLPVPNVPESASDTDPATATGLVLRPLGGVIVDMDTPTIQNGLPQ